MPFTVSQTTGSVSLCAEGKNYVSVFIDGARGLFSLLFDIEKVRDEERSKIVVQAKDMQSLYARWLEELVSRHEIEKIVYSEFSIASIQEVDGGYLATGAAYGETYDASRHVKKAKHILVHGKTVRMKKDGDLCVCTIEVSVG